MKIDIPDLSKTPSKGFSTLGATGTPNYGGYLVTNEQNASLSGTSKYETFSDILANVSIVGAGTRYFLNLVSKPSWRVESADDTDEAKELAEFVEDVMDKMETPFHRVIRRAAMYRFYGFSIQEWTAMRRKDGKIVYKDIAPRPQVTIEKWNTSYDGKVKGVYQRAPQDGREIFLPREKIIYVVDDSVNDSPEGLGLFRHLVEPAKRLQRFEELEAIGFETDLRGVPIGRVPFAALNDAIRAGTFTKAEVDSMTKPVRDFIENHIRGKKTGIVVDSTPYKNADESQNPSATPMWNVELLNSGITSLPDIYTAISRITTEIARVLGVEGLLLGGNDRGSLALSKDKSHNFYLIVDSTINELRATYEKDFLDPLWRLNGFDDELKPRFKPDAIQFRDVESISRALRDISTTDLTEKDEAMGVLFDNLGLPRLEEDRQTHEEIHPPQPMDFGNDNEPTRNTEGAADRNGHELNRG